MDANLKYFFNFYINGQDMTAFLISKVSFSFGESIFSLYPTAILELNLPSFLLEDGILSIGANARFEIFNTKETKPVIREYKVWKITSRTGENRRSLTGMYSITFIHPWYFNQEVKSKAYGGSVEMVLANLFSESLSTKFNKFYMSKSADLANKYYRTYQNIGEFIENRLIKNYVVDNSPVFMYVTGNNEFHAHSFLSMLNNGKENKLIDTTSIDIEKSKIERSETLNRLVVPFSIQYSLNASGELINRLNTRVTSLSKVHSVSKLETISGESSFFGYRGFYPIHKDQSEIDYPLSVYTNDSEANPESIRADNIRKQIPLLLDQSFSINCYPNFTIQVGEPIDLYLKKDDKKDSVDSNLNSIFYATYLITNIKHIQLKDDFMTQMTLSRDVIQPLEKNTLKAASNIISL